MGFRGYWDTHEEDLLRKGVQKHGIGSWERIRHDPEFKVLKGRTGVQLKDKWRNLVKFQHVGRDEAGRAPVRSYRGGQRRRAGRGSKSDGGASKSAPQEVVRAVRAAPVPEPEPLNDFERARLENIRRNQEALAALMGGVQALPAQMNQATPAKKQQAESAEVLHLRSRKAAAEAALQAALSRAREAEAIVSRAEDALARGASTEAAINVAVASKNSANSAVQQAERDVNAANAALQAALAQVAQQAATRKRVRAEPQVPERTSLRVAAKPRKTYAEDDVPLDEEDRRDTFVGRVVEDRRFGIYDARRYRLQTDGEGNVADAVIVKSYRDSATYKRRHGILLDEPEELDTAAPADVAGGRRGRGGVALQAPDHGDSKRRGGSAASAPGKAGRSTSRSQRHGEAAAAGAPPGRRDMAHHAHFGAPVVPPSLPLWVSKLPELVAARKYPLHTWARQALRSALVKGGGSAPVFDHRKRPQNGPGSGKPRRGAQSAPQPRGAGAATAAQSLINSDWMTDGLHAAGGSLLGSFGTDTGDLMMDVPWRHDAF